MGGARNFPKGTFSCSKAFLISTVNNYIIRMQEINHTFFVSWLWDCWLKKNTHTVFSWDVVVTKNQNSADYYPLYTSSVFTKYYVVVCVGGKVCVVLKRC